MKKAILSFAILMSLSLIFSISCGGNAQPPSGELPTWKVGDSWTERDVSEYGTSTSVRTVTGEQVYNGIDCYITEGTFTMTGMTINRTTAFDKTTLKIIGDEYSLLVNGSTLTVITNLSYNYSVNPYPLILDKTWTVTGNMTYTIIDAGENQSTTNIYNAANTICKVEGVESITVPAGTFQCFKIEQSSDNGSDIQWVTDVTRGFPVKIITIGTNNTTERTTELISYSLSE